ncbi:glycoside hydrolase [candidate division KSB1 bacterium]|nr:glycoside hydrolase [candidate division KSB1 bacterium]RQW11801.1 MAG: glycoside hydrolase [candidate division KSB1 bacterium]
MKKQCLLLIFLLALFSISSMMAAEWPSFESIHKPWTRWWWHGNAVDSAEIDRHLREFARVGIGGIEVTSIYGVRGREDDSIPYLSPRYLDILNYTAQQAKSLDLGVDLPPGSGWRCGGLGLDARLADAVVVFAKDTVRSGETFTRRYEEAPQAIYAFSSQGDKINLAAKLQDNLLVWQPPGGTWIVYSVSQKWSGAQVKRPAPGGEGYSFNPYSRASTQSMLRPLTAAFDQLQRENVRSIFHDSFEYTGNWSDSFFAEFKDRRGYDLRQYLPELEGVGAPEIVRRVKCDYRETIADLVRENFILLLKTWSNERGWKLRNQSHGSPANLLDLYGLVDIPEIEIFRFDRDPRVLRFASSAAHVTGKPLVSAESFTWQDEHFHVTLDTMKRSADLLFACGINHIFFHGTAYSPQDAEWPGWLFYASSQINPQNTIWRDLPAFNLYVTRCQSLLQSCQPDNDLLIYWPVYDVWSDAEGLNKMLAVHHPQWITHNPAGHVSAQLDELGVSYDFISDGQIKSARAQGGRIALPGASYESIIVPHCEHMPIETLNALHLLAKEGATILFTDELPRQVPGLFNWQSRQKLLAELSGSLRPDASGVRMVGAGRAVTVTDFERALALLGLAGEPLGRMKKLDWHRKRGASGHLYFFSNRGERIDGWIELGREFASVRIFDPMTGQIGMAKSRGDNSLYLQIESGESLFLQTYAESTSGPEWSYWRRSGVPHHLGGVWHIDFVEGGPALPASCQQKDLASWTMQKEKETWRFAGTARYTLTFDAPVAGQRFYRLDLGRAAESAQVVLNGADVGTLFSRPFALNVELNPSANRLEIFVTNLAANRIRDLDRRGIAWRLFHDINFVNIDYKPFDASDWPIRESGLLGPVTLTPLTKMEF